MCELDVVYTFVFSISSICGRKMIEHLQQCLADRGSDGVNAEAVKWGVIVCLFDWE